jgi:cyclohexanecarboxylate-CoA ligase
MPNRHPLLPKAKATEYRTCGLWADMTAGDWLDRQQQVRGEAIAIVDGARRVSYAELGQLVSRFAQVLRDLGVGQGDVVAVQLSNSVEFNVAFLSAASVGAVVNPIAPFYRTREVEYMLRRALAKVFVGESPLRGFDYGGMIQQIRGELPNLEHVILRGTEATPAVLRLEELINGQRRTPRREASIQKIDPSDVVVLVYTSGSEGEPKGVTHTHNSLTSVAVAMQRHCGLGAEDVLFTPASAGHLMGLLVSVWMPLVWGAATVVVPGWDPASALDLMRESGVTYLHGPPTMLRDILDVPTRARPRLASLRMVRCSAATIPRGLIAEAAGVLGCPILPGYGFSEGLILTSGYPNDPLHTLINTDGSLLPGVEVRLVNEDANGVGELAFRGPTLFFGYWNRPDLTRRVVDDDGWYYSGDRCSIDGEGRITVHGRIKDLIIRAGLNISPREIEELLAEHPQVGEVSVIGLTHPRVGEQCCAVVVPRGARPPTLEGVNDYLERRGLARFKLPEQLVIVPELPRTSIGKVNKSKLAQQVVASVRRKRSSGKDSK